MAFIWTVCVILITVSDALSYEIKRHTCKHVVDNLICEWRGVGVYQTDRPLPGIRTVVFPRLTSSCLVDVRHNMPELETLKVESGTINCQQILTAHDIYTTINGRKCPDESTTLDVGVSAPETANLDMPSRAFESSRKTTIKLQVDADNEEHAFPVVSVTWDDLLQVRIILIIVLVILLLVSLVSLSLYLKRHKLPCKKHQREQHSSEDVELFSAPHRIPTYKFEEFINSTHLKES